MVGCSRLPGSAGPPTISSLRVTPPASLNPAWIACSMVPTRSPSAMASFKRYSPGGRLAPAVYWSDEGTPFMTGCSRASAVLLSAMRPF